MIQTETLCSLLFRLFLGVQESAPTQDLSGLQGQREQAKDAQPAGPGRGAASVAMETEGPRSSAARRIALCW